MWFAVALSIFMGYQAYLLFKKKATKEAFLYIALALIALCLIFASVLTPNSSRILEYFLPN